MKKVQTFERGQVWYVSETIGKSTLSSYFTNDTNSNNDRKNMNVSIYDKLIQPQDNDEVEIQSQNQQYDGSIQGKSRPYLIVSNNACNESSPVITVVPFTSKDKKYLPTHVYVNLYGHKQTILCEQVRAFNKKNLESNGSYFISKMPDYIMKKVDKCLAIQLGLNVLEMAQTEINQTQYQVETLSKLTKTISKQQINDTNQSNLNSSNQNHVEAQSQSQNQSQKSSFFKKRWSDDDKLEFIEQFKNHTAVEMSTMYHISISTALRYKSSFKKELENK